MDRLRSLFMKDNSTIYDVLAGAFHIKTAANICPVYMYYESSSGNFIIRLGTSSSTYKYFVFKSDGTTSF